MRPSARQETGVPGPRAAATPHQLPRGVGRTPGLGFQVAPPIRLGLLFAPACQGLLVLGLCLIGSFGATDLLVPNALFVSETPGVLLGQEFGFLELIAEVAHADSLTLGSVGGALCEPNRQSSLA